MVLNLLLIYILGYVMAVSLSIGYFMEANNYSSLNKEFLSKYATSILLISITSWVLVGVVLGEIRAKLK